MNSRCAATAWRVPDHVDHHAGEVPERVDVAVVGAGLTGLSCAYHLLEDDPKASVLVLDAGELGAGASGRTTGMVTPGIGQDFAGHVKRLGAYRAARLYEETREAVRYVGELVAAEKIDCDHEVVGQLVIAHREAGIARLALQAEALEATGQPCKRLHAAALAQRVKLEFGNRHPNSAGLAAIFLPDAAILDPLMFVHGLARAVESRGGRIRCNTRVEGVSHGKAPSLHLASGQVVAARTVILATASQSPAFAHLAGRIIPVSLKVLATEPLTGGQLAAIGWQQHECIIDSRKLFNYFRLTSDGRVVFGGGMPAYGPVVAANADFDDLEAELRRTFPDGQALRVARRWSGTIDYTLDGLPVVGPVHPEGNVIYAGGFCGHGIALGVRAGRWVSGIVAHRKAPPFHSLFRGTAPLVPGEWLRRACFSIASHWMRLRGV